MADEFFKDWVSPNGKVGAVVEREGDGIFFYLHGPKESDFGVRSCWVRNLAPAPEQLDVEGMREGRAPLLPADCCAHKQGLPVPELGDLEVVWLEECDAAALLEKREILAVIPAWSGYEGFHGFARDCIKESTLCWPMGNPKENVLFERVRKARAFWHSWDEGRWESYREEIWKPLESAFGTEEKYYAIDGGSWPPRALMQFRVEDTVVLCTAGMSILPQPNVERTHKNPQPYRRVELGWAMSSNLFQKIGQYAMRYMSAQAGLPWEQFTWLGDGHTIGCGGPLPECGFDAMLLSVNPPGAPEIELPMLDSDPIRILWIIPITSRERNIARESGSKQLWQELNKEGRTWVTPAYKS